MAPRVLVCVEDNDVAHTVARLLAQGGADAGRVERPSALVDEARAGAAVLVVQDRYSTGEAATALLRQLRVVRGESTPAVVVMTGALPVSERMILERQYKVQAFIEPREEAPAIARAATSAAGIEFVEQDASSAQHSALLPVTAPLNEHPTVEQAAEPREANPDPFSSPQPTDTFVPLPSGSGASAFDYFLPPASAEATASGPEASDSIDTASTTPPAATSGSARAMAQGEPVQSMTIDTQKAQNDLKRSLLQERKLKEAAQQRVEELEARLSRYENTTKTASGVPTEGMFEDIRFPALLARCRADAFTGAISMQSGAATRTVYLRDGLPTAFHSSEPGERIGRVLVTQGRITDEQYMKATTRSVERSIKLVDALVELGWMDAETIALEQRNLTRDQIISSFELAQGRFSVKASVTPDATIPTFEFGPGEIYVQGYRRYAPAIEMKAAFETLRELYLVANARLASYRPKLGLNGDDEKLLRLLGEALTVEEAAERAQVSAEAAARLLSALMALELVEEWQPGVEQFRNRLRTERQRHVDELNAVLQESRQREQRLMEAFERALSAGGSSVRSVLEDRSAPAAPVTRSASVSASASASAGSEAEAAPPPATAQAPASSSPVVASSPPSGATSGSAPPSSTASTASTASTSDPVDGASAAVTPGTGAPPGDAPSASSAPTSRTGSPGSSPPSKAPPKTRTSPSSTSVATSSPPPAASVPPSSSAASAGGSSSASASPPAPTATATAATTAPAASSPPAADQGPRALAAARYREAMEHVAHNRLAEAEVALRESVRLNARAEYLTALAKVLLQNPRYERAGTLPVVKSLLDRAVHIAPDNKEASELHAEVVRDLGV